MPITPTNIPKHAITPSANTKGGYVLWGDPVFTWGSTIAQWGAPVNTFANVAKHAITPTNQSKN